jgi:hypothetical protein
MEMAVRSMETAKTAMETDGDGSGGTSPSRQVPEQRLLSPEIWLRRRWRCGTVLEISPTPLGFSVPRLYIGEGASSGGCQGALTRRGRGSRLVLVLRPRKIRLLELVSFNSENISYVAFLKHKNSRKQGTGIVASCQ